VLVCASCGHENSEGAKFCEQCGFSFAAAPARAKEQRKTVTVLFCDLTGSTELGEKLDPETLRALLARYFERMKGIVESHGGSVEKFIGDAVMAVFGVPVVHEDDALRAVRAAVEMREAFPELGVEGRIGVTTGEVVTGTEERLATGDAVNVAARLEQAAQPGEILIGDETYRLTRDAVEVEEVEPLQLKGKAEPVEAHRLLSLRSEALAIERHLEAPMVGRSDELDLLTRAYERSMRERACHLFTILGPAGVGKSRLAAEFLASLGDAVVVRGRCLPYGEGITYWPVVEIVKQLPEAELDELAAQTIRGLTSDEQLVTSSEEIAWAFRKLLEAVAGTRPLVCVFDDVHWGEETFLDLVEHVADLSRDAPILLLCMARPDLLDRRTGWGGGKVNATTVLLEPLAPEETERLIESLAEVDEGLRERIREASEGNPLFVEEMVAMLRESLDGEVAVPPTIQALLAARLDQLEPHEREVLQCGSVEGRVFHRGAVQALAPEEPQVMAQLTALVRKELVRPDKPQLPGEDAFRFRHLLIRDAAYDALPKATRAELHERFADWLEEHGATLVELDEILGHHLEQAYRYWAELGPVDERARAVGQRAAERLAEAGHRALARADMPAAVNLLDRAEALVPVDDLRRLEWAIDLSASLIEVGELARAEALLEEATKAARAAGDQRLECRASVQRAFLRVHTDPEGSTDEARREAERAISVFEELCDELELARAWQLASHVEFFEGAIATSEAMLERALVHARGAGDAREEARILRWLASSALWGPVPVEEGIRRCEEILEHTRGNSLVQANCHIRLAGLEGMRGRFSEARARVAQARAILTEFGLTYFLAHSRDVAALVETLAGNPAGAEAELRASYEELRDMGEKTFLAENAAQLAQALYAQGRYDEADRFVRVSEEASSGRARKAYWGPVRAKLLARRGEATAAEALARESVAIWAERDDLLWHGYALMDLAEVLRLAARGNEAVPVVEDAVELFERKGIIPAAEAARAQLAELEDAAPR
jgi:class 3 adenylate cyclase/predicted ATPase